MSSSLGLTSAVKDTVSNTISRVISSSSKTGQWLSVHLMFCCHLKNDKQPKKNSICVCPINYDSTVLRRSAVSADLLVQNWSGSLHVVGGTETTKSTQKPKTLPFPPLQ